MSAVSSPVHDRVTRAVILLALMLFAILPLLSMLTAALAPQNSTPPGLAWPEDPQWSNFADAWTSANFLALFRSSVLIVLGVVPAAVAMAAAAGYALAQLDVPGGRFVEVLLLVGLTLPFEALITPLYYNLRDMGLLGTRWAVILPLIGLLMPFGVFWMRASFRTMETALTEAAKLDGASTWQIFRRVQLPLAVPALSALTILFFLATWNQYLLPLVLVDDPTMRTVAGGLGAFQGEHGTNIALLCAGSLLIIAPSLLVFLFFQRHFVKALLQGAVK
ncbi:carbohydrate ABC transporter permease [Promicromonospora sp. NPDC052451]|uniref:carbohydrate ABC transporter permease n=1 Tax=unclassified Promicromonospora TaxID=2647929 RepID=UPI0037CBB27F